MTGEPQPPAEDRPPGQEGYVPNDPPPEPELQEEEPTEEGKGLLGKLKDAVTKSPDDDGPPGGAEAMSGI
jgi:hypothetical protein